MHSHYQHKIECSFSQSTTKARCASSKFFLFNFKVLNHIITLGFLFWKILFTIPTWKLFWFYQVLKNFPISIYQIIIRKVSILSKISARHQNIKKKVSRFKFKMFCSKSGSLCFLVSGAAHQDIKRQTIFPSISNIKIRKVFVQKHATPISKYQTKEISWPPAPISKYQNFESE